MTTNNACEKCNSVMSDTYLTHLDGTTYILHCCFECGYHYESGFRYNKLTKQFVKYVRFYP
ncbi:MAG: hypothetical protein ACFE9T_15745 [Promethearchaeota archaeon]